MIHTQARWPGSLVTLSIHRTHQLGSQAVIYDNALAEKIMTMTDNNNSGRIINISFGAARVEDTMAKAYRLGRRNGELVLQGCFQWTQGLDYGHEWRDIPIVDLDAAKTL